MAIRKEVEMKEDSLFGDFEFWKTYPERDPEFPRWYPPTLQEIDPGDIWSKREIGLYIHIPFCKILCKYCPFNKYAWNSEKVDRFLKALENEIRMYTDKSYLQDSTVVAVYFGGGTPTCLNTEQLVDLMKCCRENFAIARKAEISMEVNPDTADEYKLQNLFDEGVNRISFGVQSFNDRLLQMIGRPHKATRALSAIDIAKQIGFDIINIDLLYRLPTQTLVDWEKDLRQALELGLENLSVYELGIEPGTKLFDEIQSGRVPPQSDDKAFIEMHDMAIHLLTDAGYYQYNQCYDFALPGKECVYNTISLGHVEYLGIGPGAFSYIHGYIYCTSHSVEEYIRTANNGRIPISAGKKISREEEMSRYMVHGMICLEVDKNKFRERFGVQVDDIFGGTLQKLEAQGLIITDDGSVRLTHKGKIYSNNVSKAFYTKENVRIPQPSAVLIKSKYI